MTGQVARKSHRGVTVVALLLALFMAAMEATVVSTAMPTVVADLGGALHYAWVFSAYMLTSTVTVPIYGKLADLYGRRPIMQIAMALFLVGSMASGQAHSMTALVVFRAVQGVGAGGLQPLAMTIVGDIFKLEERARMQAVFGMVWVVAGLVGPVLGAIIVSALSWRWIFYVNVPFGIVAAVLLWWGLVEDIDRSKRPVLDVGGAAALVITVVALLLGADGILPAVLLPIAAVGVVAFLAIERRAKEPMLPLSLLRTPIMATSSLMMAMGGGAMLGVMTFVPVYAQGVLGATPTLAGSLIALMAVSWPIASATSGRLIPRVGYPPLIRIGALVTAASMTGLAWSALRGARTVEIGAASLAFGIGMGLSNTPILIAVQQSVGFSQRGTATAGVMFARNIGGTVGVGVMGAVLSRTLLAGAAGAHDAGPELVARLLGPERKTIDPSVLHAIAGDLERGFGRVALIVTALTVVSVVVAFAFPKSVAEPPAN